MNHFESIEVDHLIIYEGNNYVVSVEYFFATEGVFDDGDDECPPSQPEIDWGDAKCVAIHIKTGGESGHNVSRNIPEEEWSTDVISLAMQIDYPDKEVLHDLYERRCELEDSGYDN